MDETGAYYIEWSKPERKTPIQYTNAYIWQILYHLSHQGSQRHHFANKIPHSQSYGFSSSHVQMCELDHKEGWALKNWFFWTIVLEKTLESALDSMEVKSVCSKGNQSWIFIGRTDAEAAILCHLMSRANLLEKTLMLGKIEGKKKGVIRKGDSVMASSTQWTWVWENSGRWWRRGKPGGVQQSMGLRRGGCE